MHKYQALASLLFPWYDMYMVYAPVPIHLDLRVYSATEVSVREAANDEEGDAEETRRT